MAPGFAWPDRLLNWTARGSDGRRRVAWLFLPDTRAAEIPLVLSPHPFGFTAILNLFGEPAGGSYTLNGIDGVAFAAASLGAAVLCVDAEGARYSGMSVGLEAQIATYQDAADTALSAGLGLDPARVVACGLSMGGQEALLLASALPKLVKAVAVQNAITDLAGWYHHLVAIPEMEAHARSLLKELGGDPDLNPDRWTLQSPIGRLDSMPMSTPIQLRLNSVDTVVPAISQGLLYYVAAQKRGCSIELVEDVPTSLDPRDRGRSAHEHADWLGMLKWLLARL